MGKLSFHKVTAPPVAPFTADGLYLVKEGSGFTLYATDKDGTAVYRLNSQAKSQNEKISVSTTAVSNAGYDFLTDLTLTLPAAPAEGDFVRFKNLSGTKTCVIARNGKKIMGLDQDMTVDMLYGFGTLIFNGVTHGWVFE